MNNRFLLHVCAFLCVLSLLSFGQAQARLPNNPTSTTSTVTITPGNPIEIAVAMYNAWPTFQDTYDAVQMALNDYGPIKGFSLQRNDYDAGCDQTAGETAGDAIVAHTQNVGVIGPLCSVSTRGAAPKFEAAGLVMISHANTMTDLYTYGPNVFNRTVIPDPGFDGWDPNISALPSVQTWEAAFQTAYGRAPEPLAKYAYDAATLLLTRIDEVSVLSGGNLVIDRARLAAAVRNTFDFNGVTGNVALTVEGDRINEFRELVWGDPFTTSTLDSHWNWEDEDPTHWSLTANPGHLRIITQQTFHNRLYQDINPIIRYAPTDSEIRAHVVFTPTQNFQMAGITVFLDGQNTLTLGRAFCDVPPPTCQGNAIYFDHIEDDVFVGSNYAMTTTATSEAYLRMVRNGNTYTGYVSTNGTQWTLVGSHTISFVPAYFGLRAGNQNQPVSEMPADFDFFVVQRQKFDLTYIPLVIGPPSSPE